jgi:hypothetical protein
MFDVASRGEEIWNLVVEAFGIGCNHRFLRVKLESSHPYYKALMPSFPPLAE